MEVDEEAKAVLILLGTEQHSWVSDTMTLLGEQITPWQLITYPLLAVTKLRAVVYVASIQERS